MPRQRFIWPSIWTDPVLGRLKELELLFYIGAFSNADDEGKLLGDATYLRATIFPYSKLGVTRMRRIRDSVVSKVSSIELYVVDGVEYLRFPRWAKWQKPKYPSPSQYPDPLPDSGNGSGNDSPRVETTPEEPSGNVSLRGRGVGLGWVGKEEGAKAPCEDLPQAAEDDPIDEQAVQRVYSTWRACFDKKRSNYNTISVKRRKIIKRRLKKFSAGDLCRALEAVKLERPRWWITHDDLTTLLDTDERVEHFLDLIGKPVVEGNGPGRNGMSPAEIVAYTKGRA